MKETKKTVGRSLITAHHALQEVLACLDGRDPTRYKVDDMISMLFEVAHMIPAKLMAYEIQGEHTKLPLPNPSTPTQSARVGDCRAPEK